MMGISATTLAFEINQEDFKFFKIESFTHKQPITESFFNTETAELYRPYYTNHDSYALISFSISLSQYASIKLYEYAEPATMPTGGNKETLTLQGKTGINDSTILGAELGFISAQRYTGNISFFDETEEAPEKVVYKGNCNIVADINYLIDNDGINPTPMINEFFYGITGDRTLHLSRNSAASAEPVTFIHNLMIWTGDVVDEYGNPVEIEWDSSKTYQTHSSC
jgi:hypothetical protein